MRAFGRGFNIILLVTRMPHVAYKRVLDSIAIGTCLLREQSINCSVVTGKS